MGSKSRWVFLWGLMLYLATAGAVDKLQVMALFPGKAMLSIDGKRQVLANGETSPEGVQLLNANPNEAEVLFNGETRVLRLGSAVSTSYQERRANVVHIVRDNAGAFVVNGTINGRSVNFLVDTGASVLAMSEAEASRLNIPYQADGVPAFAATAGGRVKAWAVTLERVNVGEIGLDNVSAMIIQGTNPPRVLLGMSFLGQVKIEHENNLMTLTRQQ